jgi:glycosyltransferase involved in cell wall biosynthesis
MNLCIAKPNKNCAIETFINNHIRYLHPAEILCEGYFPWQFEGRPGTIFRFPLSNRYVKGMVRRLFPSTFEKHYDNALARFLHEKSIHVVFAEYGPVGANITRGCRIAGVPLLVTFHGFDASDRETLAAYQKGYRALFAYATKIIAVSRPMREKLISLGAPADKLCWNPYGVDTATFRPAANQPADGDPVRLIFIGRLTYKKAPDLLISAFHLAQNSTPNCQLTIVGSGEMKQACLELIRELRLTDKITLQDAVSPDQVPGLLRKADIYVQHSVVSASGDSEGTPNSILEASASGLPVVSTLHGGIPDVIIHGETGFLTAEKDVPEMARYISMLVSDAALRQRLGQAGRKNIETHFTLEKSIEVIRSLLADAVQAAGS